MDVEKVARAVPDEAVEAAVDAYGDATGNFERAGKMPMRAAIEAALAAIGEEIGRAHV